MLLSRVVKNAVNNIRPGKRFKGEVVLVKDNVLGFNNLVASGVDRLSEFVGEGITLQLVSAVHGENEIATEEVT
ncbi:hypothetical protein L484_000610 [Morus notabilis]|uniref:Uncharacterized protein n=1 Tax=Morus notabilis TaxID=981085 RepID=W9R005_9ROSA|nr:hypothetical protein L484_000610 [Morus notabilis]